MRLKLLFSLLLLCGVAAAAPVTNCALNTTQAGFTCNVYETLADGTPSEVSSIFTLPAQVQGGFVILFESIFGSRTDASTWSDVLQFGDGSSAATNTIQLWSDGGFTTPFIDSVLRSTSVASLVETQSGTGNDFTDFTTYVVSTPGGQNIYNIFSDAPVNESDTPEPVNSLLVLLALAGFACASWDNKSRERGNNRSLFQSRARRATPTAGLTTP